MKRWYDTQLGAPFFHAALTNRIDARASFAGTSALKIVPILTTRGQAQFVGSSVANFNGLRLLPAIAQFAGASTFFGLLSGKLVPAVASFAGVSTLAFVRPNLVQQISSQFAGVSTQAANLTLFGARQPAFVNFAGTSAFKADGTIKGRIQATANFAGASTMALLPRQRMAAVAKFAGSSNWLLIPRLRQSAIARFVGVGVWQSFSDIIPAGGGIVPSAPVLALASTASDTTPDFTVDLLIGVVDGTEARINDILVIEWSNNAGAIWNPYLTHQLVSGDFVGTSFSATATALPSNTYWFRAQLVRGALHSAWSTTVSGSIFIPPLAPSFVITSSASDNTPDFVVTLPSGNGNDNDAAVNDVLVFQISLDNGINWQAYFPHVIVLADIPIVTLSGPFLAEGTYVIRARLERNITISSAWSANWTIRIGSVVIADMYLRPLSNKPITINPSTLCLRAAGPNATDPRLRTQAQKPDEPSMLSLRAQVDKG